MSIFLRKNTYREPAICSAAHEMHIGIRIFQIRLPHIPPQTAHTTLVPNDHTAREGFKDEAA